MAQDVEIIEPLTPRERRFVENILAGQPQYLAYQEAWGSTEANYNTLSVAASNLRSSSKIRLRFQEIDDEAKENAVLTRVEYITAQMGISNLARREGQFQAASASLKCAASAQGVSGENIHTHRHAHLHADLDLDQLNDMLAEVRERERAIGLD